MRKLRVREAMQLTYTYRAGQQQGWDSLLGPTPNPATLPKSATWPLFTVWQGTQMCTLLAKVQRGWEGE